MHWGQGCVVVHIIRNVFKNLRMPLDVFGYGRVGIQTSGTPRIKSHSFDSEKLVGIPLCNSIVFSLCG